MVFCLMIQCIGGLGRYWVKSGFFTILSLLGILVASQSNAANPSQLTVIMSGGFASAFQELRPEFEKASGISIATVIRGASQGSGPDTIPAQLRRGVYADVVIMSREGLHEMKTEGRIAPDPTSTWLQPCWVRVSTPGPPGRTSAPSKPLSGRCCRLNRLRAPAPAPFTLRRSSFRGWESRMRWPPKW